MPCADIGLIGLAVMGENLVMNMESKGFTVAVYNRTRQKTEAFVNGRASGKNIMGCYSLEELTSQLKKPRIVFLMIKAGNAVDEMIDQLLKCLEEGDIIVDGGQFPFPGYDQKNKVCRVKRTFVCGHRSLRRRGRRFEGAKYDAGRQPCGMAVCQTCFSGGLCKGRGRNAML